MWEITSFWGVPDVRHYMIWSNIYIRWVSNVILCIQWRRMQWRQMQLKNFWCELVPAIKDYLMCDSISHGKVPVIYCKAWESPWCEIVYAMGRFLVWDIYTCFMKNGWSRIENKFILLFNGCLIWYITYNGKEHAAGGLGVGGPGYKKK